MAAGLRHRRRDDGLTAIAVRLDGQDVQVGAVGPRTARERLEDVDAGHRLDEARQLRRAGRPAR